jgi:perosamine synthetase
MGADRDPFIPMAVPVLDGNESRYVNEALETGWISSQGRFVTEFESGFAAYCGAEQGVAVTSGTTALHLAFAALGLGPGDEIVIPAVTHIAVANMIALTGARPVLVDIDPATWTLDPNRLEAAITDRARAIVVVHLYGHPADMDPINDIAERHGLTVIEDAAEAHGAEYLGKRVGGLGRVACFSFYANKIITTGEGGMIVTNDSTLADRARKLRSQADEPGAERRFWHREAGYNYRMTNLQAAVGVAQLERLNDFVARHRRTADRYAAGLEDVEGLALQGERAWAKNVYWMYSVLVDADSGTSRDDVAGHLRSQGIDSRPFFVPIHRQPAYGSDYGSQGFPVAERIAETGLNLPSGNELDEEDIARVTAAVREAMTADSK